MLAWLIGCPRVHLLNGQTSAHRFHAQYPTKPLFSSEAVICFSERGVDKDFCPEADPASGQPPRGGGCQFNNEVANCTANQVGEGQRQAL